MLCELAEKAGLIITIWNVRMKEQLNKIYQNAISGGIIGDFPLIFKYIYIKKYIYNIYTYILFII